MVEEQLVVEHQFNVSRRGSHNAGPTYGPSVACSAGPMYEPSVEWGRVREQEQSGREQSEPDENDGTHFLCSQTGPDGVTVQVSRRKDRYGKQSPNHTRQRTRAIALTVPQGVTSAHSGHPLPQGTISARSGRRVHMALDSPS